MGRTDHEKDMERLAVRLTRMNRHDAELAKADPRNAQDPPQNGDASPRRR